MKIDLTSADVFEDNELEIDKSITFVFGKNGTGKSTIANEIQKLDSDYDVSIFQGFNNIIDEKQRLNAIVLGEENTLINTRIEQKEAELEQVMKQIKIIEDSLNKPSNGEISNFWTRRENANKNYELLEKKLEKFYRDSASKIKKIENPRVVNTSYNKNFFQSDIPKALLLQEYQIEELTKTIISESKKAPNIIFPHLDNKELLNETNSLLQKCVKEKVKINRIDNSAKREFAREGLKIHKRGEICAFCGNKIKNVDYDELVSYFSADEVKAFRDQLINKIDIIDQLVRDVSIIEISIANFYPSYEKAAKLINEKIIELKKSNINFLNNLKNALDDKQKYLFESKDKLNIYVPDNFDNVSEKYNLLCKENNDNDIDEKKDNARAKLRYHYVKQEINEFDYDVKEAKLSLLLTEKNQRIKEYEDEKRKIYGTDGLEEKRKRILGDIQELRQQTKSESLLAENINRKLLHMVSFKLEHYEDNETRGFYRVKDPKTNKNRKITELSTGEKNIIAFLYFIEKLNEIKDISTNKPKIIVFDDPMNSNDDGMQYLIIEELQSLMKEISKDDFFILLTHNKHFYINVKYGHKYNKDNFIRLESDGHKTKLTHLTNDNDDFKTSYEALWYELKFLYKCNDASPDMMLNPIRRIIETFTKFNSLKKTDFCKVVVGSKKLFDVNSHSIDDMEAELNGKTKYDILKMLYDCFDRNGYEQHVKQYCNFISSID